MRTSDFDYALPDELIAQTPIEPRDRSRLMVCDRQSGEISHGYFFDLPKLLTNKDVLVVNDTRVIPARLIGSKQSTHGAVEVLLLHRIKLNVWEAIVKPGARLREGTVVEFGGGLLRGTIMDMTDAGGRIVEFSYDGKYTFENLLDKLGQTPLPPYIKEKLEDPNRYQTVYAARDGSAAAPTAGLHFTPELLAAIEGMGVRIVKVLLHVGLGTFRPVSSDDPLEHKMHSEYFEMAEDAASAINAARQNGGRCVCVGTTTARVLETCADGAGVLHAGTGWTDIFIYPGIRVKAVDALITNFHLPRSTLLMLISAFWNRESVLNAYRAAVEARYRFYSLGDAMMIM
ncbi:MAG: tRNA preQ1(34) S-adenosylmethionine ribosyltransferase-isomerase QueA [Oscillospiraceae bacterium]|nr:tRNA preQ1(34) S-adenosylmethionine ribosyltransferase-isomerase QueA [Oscillospiraceae bacterium]